MNSPAAVEPEEKSTHAQNAAPAAQGAQRGGKLDPPAAEREEVHSTHEEGQQRSEEDELDRPAAHDPVAEVDVARRALRQLDSCVERGEEALRCAPELTEPLRVQALARIGEGVAAALRQGREGDRRDAVADKRALLAGSERKSEVDELPESRRPAVPAPASSSTRAARMRTSAAAGERGASPASSSRGPRPASASG